MIMQQLWARSHMWCGYMTIEAVMFCSWEGNCMSVVPLAMRHRLNGIPIIHLRTRGLLNEGDLSLLEECVVLLLEHFTYTHICRCFLCFVAEEVKRLCAAHFGNIFFLDWSSVDDHYFESNAGLCCKQECQLFEGTWCKFANHSDHTGAVTMHYAPAPVCCSSYVWLFFPSSVALFHAIFPLIPAGQASPSQEEEIGFFTAVIIIIIIKNEKIKVTLCENAAGVLYIVSMSCCTGALVNMTFYHRISDMCGMKV